MTLVTGFFPRHQFSISLKARLFPELFGPTRIKMDPNSTFSEFVLPGVVPALNVISLNFIGIENNYSRLI
jgi:hypothetical protein